MAAGQRNGQGYWVCTDRICLCGILYFVALCRFISPHQAAGSSQFQARGPCWSCSGQHRIARWVLMITGLFNRGQSSSAQGESIRCFPDNAACIYEVAPSACDNLSPVALAYIRSRNGDPMCSFGDFVAVSSRQTGCACASGGWLLNIILRKSNDKLRTISLEFQP